MARSSAEQIEVLHGFSACDVSDALLKLEKPVEGRPPKAGYLANIVPYAPSAPWAPRSGQPKIIARASTLKLIDKLDITTAPPENESQSIPKGSHWVDETEEGTVLIIEQPTHHTCAAVGGIMAIRMKVRGLQGCVVGGRVRDMTELEKSGLPIWASGQSTVGAGAETKVHSRNVTVNISGVNVSPNDIVFADPIEGVVVIPNGLVDQVIELMPKLVSADDKVKEEVESGTTVQAAFKRHRN